MIPTVLHIIPRFYLGGAERLVLAYATKLDATQYRVVTASCVDDGALRAEFEAAGAAIWVGSKAKQGGRLAIQRALKSYVRELQPDIIHTHLLSADVTGARLKRAFPHIKWVSTLHNTEAHRPWLYRQIWKRALRHVDQVISVSPGVERYAREAFHIRDSINNLIPNGIDLSIWKSHPSNPLFSTTPYQIATIGRLEVQKGHTYLLKALREIVDLPWQYHLYGDGSLRATLEEEARALGIADRVVFHGNVSDIPIELQSIDLVVQPSLWEGMSLTVMEAMAAGKPVIATFPAGEGIIDQQKTGLIVPHRHVEALRASIQQMLTDTTAATILAERARHHAFDTFAIETNVAHVVELYDELLQRNI